MPGRPRPATPARLDDVARAAGVHVSTVSRVLRGGDDITVRPETRARILAAAEHLRYRPNPHARALKSAATGALGYLVPSLRNPANSDIVRGAFDRAWRRGFVLLIAEDAGVGAAQEAYERLVEQRRIDGLLIHSARAGVDFYRGFDDGHVPCVFVDRAHEKPGRNVTMRDGDAGRLAARHLLDLGHRDLAHLTGPPDLDTVARRRGAFVAEAEAAGATTVVVEAALDEAAGYRALAAVRALAPAATAIYVANINQAIGLLAAALARGVRVPDDVSILCHDDDPLADYLSVPLTTVAMPLAELGAAAVDALVEQLEGGAPRDVVVETPPAIVVRASVGPPRTGPRAP